MLFWILAILAQASGPTPVPQAAATLPMQASGPAPVPPAAATLPVPPGYLMLKNVPVGKNPVLPVPTADGSEVWVTLGDGSAAIVDAATLEISGKVNDIGVGAWGLAFSPDGLLAVGTNFLANDVKVLDVRKRAIVRKIEVGLKPAFVVWDPAGERAYVSDHFSGELSVVRPKVGTKERDIPVMRRPMGIALSPDGATIYVGSGATKSVAVVDLKSGKSVRELPFPVGETNNLVLSRDGRTLYTVGEGFLYAIPTDGSGFGSRIPVGRDPVSLVVDATGRRAYVADFAGQKVHVVDLVAQRVLGSLPAGAGPLFLALAPKGDRLYVACSRGDSLGVYGILEKP